MDNNINKRKSQLGLANLHNETSKPEYFQKGHITESFVTNYSPIKVKKSGEEVKAKLQSAKSKEQVERDKHLLSMNDILQKCEMVPERQIEEYEHLFKGTQDRHSFIPKLFSYRQIRSCDYENSQKSSSFVSLTDIRGGSEPLDNNDERNICCIYNELVEKFVKSNTEIFILETLINSLEDKKEYEFSIHQLSSLGF